MAGIDAWFSTLTNVDAALVGAVVGLVLAALVVAVAVLRGELANGR